VDEPSTVSSINQSTYNNKFGTGSCLLFSSERRRLITHVYFFYQPHRRNLSVNRKEAGFLQLDVARSVNTEAKHTNDDCNNTTVNPQMYRCTWIPRTKESNVKRNKSRDACTQIRVNHKTLKKVFNLSPRYGKRGWGVSL